MNIPALLLSLMFLSVSDQSSESSLIQRISEIKMDTSYVYGEATLADSIESRQVAIANLNDEIQLISDMLPGPSDINILCHSRGNRIRVFAYIERAKIHTLENVKMEDDSNIVSNQAALESIIRSSKNIEELERYNGKDGYPTWSSGMVDIDTSNDTLERSYILLLKGKSGTIIDTFTPADKEHSRFQLTSGAKTNSIPFNKADKVIWIHL